MKENSTPFDVAEYDRQIKRTLPFYEEMSQQVVDIVRILARKDKERPLYERFGFVKMNDEMELPELKVVMDWRGTP